MALIVLEGLDGAGKSTQIKLLQRLVSETGARCEYLHFPRFDSPVYGDLIARFLRGELGEMEQVNPYLVALLFAGDRADAAEMLRGWLSEGRVVLLDRYVYSNVAFQCAKIADPARRDELKKWIIDTEFVQFGIPRPDLSLFLDVPFGFTREKLTAVRGGSDRDYLHGSRDIHEESLDLQRTVREVYLACAARDTSFKVVDCSDSYGRMAGAEEIFGRVRRYVDTVLEGEVQFRPLSGAGK